jgi:5,10-methylene-tetrahydrofolate dehydrogenase/methenyl tetrahydrofolate cyclohydrolase
MDTHSQEFAAKVKRLTDLARYRKSLTETYSAKILDGRAMASNIRTGLKEIIETYNSKQQAKHHSKPVMGFILVSPKEESKLYERMKA